MSGNHHHHHHGDDGSHHHHDHQHHGDEHHHDHGQARSGKLMAWLKRRYGFVLALLYLMSGVYFVAPEQQAVVTRFGRVVAKASGRAFITICPGRLKPSAN